MEPSHAVSASLQAAIESNHVGFWRRMAQAPGIRVVDDSATLHLLSDIPIDLLNVVLQARLAPDGAEAAVDTVLQRMQQSGLPHIWWVTDVSQPSNLGTLLRDRGMQQLEDAPGMANDLAANAGLFEGASAGDLELRPVRTQAAMDDWLAAFSPSFELPAALHEDVARLFRAAPYGTPGQLEHVVGYDDGIPVACGTLLVDAGVAGIYNVGTVEQARRRGAGRQVTAYLLQSAAARGLEHAVLEATPIGAGVYRRLGFRDVMSFTGYRWPAG